MKKTFNELLEKEYYFIDGIIDLVVTKEIYLELMKFVRQQTLIEAANNAEADYNIVNADDRDESTINGEVEVYVLKQSILQLDKNSIEI